MTASLNGVYYHHLHNHHRINVPSYHSNMRPYELSNDCSPVGGGVAQVSIGGVRMPDSPEAGLKSQSNNATSTSSTSGPPLISTNNHHKINSISGLNGSHSPHSSTSSGSTPSLPTPPTPPSGSSSSISASVSASHLVSAPNSTSTVTNNGSSVSAPALVSPEQLGNSVRQLSKLKRFLATLQQFGSDISPEVGERVHGLILGLVSSNLSIEEFHMKIQEVTNYPMRSFVIPLLKSHLPLLQAEVGHFARMAKQTPQQYVRQHEQALLELNNHSNNGTPSSTNFSGVNSTSDNLPSSGDRRESFDSFPDSKDLGSSLKRRSVSDSRSKENGYSENSSDGHPPPKRHQTMTSPNGVMPGGSAGGVGNARIPPGSNHIPPVGFNFRLEDSSYYRERERYERYDRYERTLHRDFTDEREMEDEWKNIHTMLSCILGMVEKTKRALAILQHRSQSERQEMAFWNSAIGRRHLLTTPPSQMDGPVGADRTADFDVKKRDLIAHYKTAEDRVTEVRRRAEEAVNEVKRQAVAELQKAVSAAETKASELVASERAKMERLLGEARRQAAEEALASINQQDETTEVSKPESCWNCGRKANETCSGCNVARYCGAFCQHKDWENHHRVCGQGSALQANPGGTPAPGIAAPTTPSSVPSTNSNIISADSRGRISPHSPNGGVGKRSPSPRDLNTEKH